MAIWYGNNDAYSDCTVKSLLLLAMESLQDRQAQSCEVSKAKETTRELQICHLRESFTS